MSVNTKYFAFGGGLDLVTPAIAMPPGRAISCLNYEPSPNGYQRVDGFERCDGQPKPSEANYWVLSFDAGTAAFVVGDTVTGLLSGATCTILFDPVITVGTYGGGDAEGTVIVTAIVGTFIDNEFLQVGGVSRCTIDGPPNERGADNDTDDDTWLQAAIEKARSLIGMVPGEGIIRGCWMYNGDRYAFRNTVGSTSGRMFKSTSTGWAEQDLGMTLDFTSGGTYEIQEGDVLTGATSAATVTVKRVILTSGSWAAGDAAGRLITASNLTDHFVGENVDVGAHLNVATVTGDPVANTLPANGRYEFVNHNFFGRSNLYRMYGVNGVGTAFEWDGTVFVPLITGADTDTPQHIAVHKNQLLLTLPGGSFMNSGVLDPYAYTALSGASEISLGTDVVGLVQDFSGTTGVLGKKKVAVLYGNDATDFELVSINGGAGGIEWTLQMATAPIYVDDKGLRDMRTTAQYGDFHMGSPSELIDPIFAKKRKTSIFPIASLVVKSKDQYRLFWDDGSGFTMYLGKKTVEILPFDLGKVARCTCAGEETNGKETLLFGSDDGYLYELDSGTSFDGEVVPAYLRMAFNHLGSPDINKQWFKAAVEMDTDPRATISISAEFDYGGGHEVPLEETEFAITGGGGTWDQSNWNEFSWSSPYKGTASADLLGFGTNVSVTFISNLIYETPHTIHGMTLHYSMRGRKL